MMKKSKLFNKEKGFFKKLNKLISKKTVAISGFLFFGFYIFMNTVFVSIFENRSNNNPYIDVQMFNSVQDFYNLLSSYGSMGRSSYIQFSIGLDIIFPLIATIFLIFTGIYIFRQISKKMIWQKIIFILPLMYFLSEIVENISFIILTMNYPNQIYSLFLIASTTTIIKTILISTSLIIIIIGFIILIVKKLLMNQEYA